MHKERENTMANKAQTDKYNLTLLKKLSIFLNVEPNYIKADMVKTVCRECDMSESEAYSFLLASAIYLDVAENEHDRELFELYFPHMIRQLDADKYSNDPYMKKIKVPILQDGAWELCERKYEPYEAFACDDLKYFTDGRVVAQIGFFNKEYRYPCVCHMGREWMLITPNEINTMKAPIEKSHGKVLTFGLGLGYFAFMAAEKQSVESVTVVECDEKVISIFKSYILPQMPCRDKMRIVHADAYEYAENEMENGGYDFVFCDIWHDPSDGVEAYKRLKEYEKLLPNAEFEYWIEQTMKYYM